MYPGPIPNSIKIMRQIAAQRVQYRDINHVDLKGCFLGGGDYAIIHRSVVG